MKIAISGGQPQELFWLRSYVHRLDSLGGAVVDVPVFSDGFAPERWRNLQSAAKRQMWREEFERIEPGSERPRHPGGLHCIAIDWGLMDAAHEGLRMARLYRELQEAAAPLIGPGGVAILGPEAEKRQVAVAVSNAIITILIENLREELDYWDLMYWKPNSGTRPEEPDVAWDMNMQIEAILTQSNIPDIDRIKMLPSDMEEAKAVLSQDIEDRVSSQ